MIRIASSQYQMEALSDQQCYFEKMESMVAEAKAANATVLVLPEYAGIEIVCKKFSTDEELFIALQPFIPSYIEFYQKLAHSYQLYIQAGTIIEKSPSGKFINRAYFFSPNKQYEFQDKLQLTQMEKKSNLFERGMQQKIFNTVFGKIAIAICYDVEFPEIVRRLTYHGASIILVPSYTNTLAGYHRVFISCRARAIENQCYVATSYMIKKVDLSDDVDETYGCAAIMGPMDKEFSYDGILQQGIMNKPMLVISDVSLKALHKIRKRGEVLNFEDTKYCAGVANNSIEIIQLF